MRVKITIFYRTTPPLYIGVFYACDIMAKNLLLFLAFCCIIRFMKKTLGFCFLVSVGLGVSAQGELSSLNIGLDYRLRGVAIDNNDTQADTNDSLNYYSQQARVYMTGWLNENVEASLRVQSLNIWGLEGSTSPVTRYPAADGSPWIENVYVNMPNLLNKHLKLVIGRQPITLGDGLLVSDDRLGFNAVRAQVSLPKKMDLDLFTAKISEGLGTTKGDVDLNAAVWALEQGDNRWELGWVREKDGGPNDYRLAKGTEPINSYSKNFYDLRLFGNLKDAYYKLEYIMQSGSAQQQNGETMDITGDAQRIELGAQSDTERFGRFGVKTVYASGSGDDPASTNKDEGFRSSFSKQWDGLQRDGMGTHYGATLSDAYNPSAPFSTQDTGLPLGASGIKTLGLGLFTVQKIIWTGTLDYYIFDSRTKNNGKNSLGTELDLGLNFRYTGYVTFALGASYFFPGDLYESANRVTRYSAETHVHF